MVCLYIDRRNIILKTERDRLLIYSSDKLLTSFPLHLLERLSIYGDTTLSASLLGKLGEHNIALLVLRGFQKTPAFLTPTIPQDAQKRVLQAQLANDDQFTLHFAKELVTHKIYAQKKTLMQLFRRFFPIEEFPKTSQRYRDFLAKIEGFDKHFLSKMKEASSRQMLLGIEGNAAKLYFGYWIELLPKKWQFSGRNRRPPRDPINALLSLGYTLLHHNCIKRLYFMGFDPYIGFYHQPKFGRASLASDLIECMRPKYDSWIIEQFDNNHFRKEDFKSRAEGCYIGKEARLKFYEQYEIWLKEQRPSFTALTNKLYLLLRQKTSAIEEESTEITYLCDIT